MKFQVESHEKRIERQTLQPQSFYHPYQESHEKRIERFDVDVMIIINLRHESHEKRIEKSLKGAR